MESLKVVTYLAHWIVDPIQCSFIIAIRNQSEYIYYNTVQWLLVVHTVHLFINLTNFRSDHRVPANLERCLHYHNMIM